VTYKNTECNILRKLLRKKSVGGRSGVLLFQKNHRNIECFENVKMLPRIARNSERYSYTSYFRCNNVR